MMRKLLIAAALALFAMSSMGSTPLHAADKGGPPATLDQILALESLKRPMTCNVELSAAGTFLKQDREASGGAGVGCDVIAANLLIGGGIRADFSDFRNTSSLFVKLGIVLNSGLHLYGWGEYKTKDLRVRDAGQALMGAGTEFKLELLSPNLWIFTEAGAAPTKFGADFQRDELLVRTGARYKF